MLQCRRHIKVETMLVGTDAIAVNRQSVYSKDDWHKSCVSTICMSICQDWLNQVRRCFSSRFAVPRAASMLLALQDPV